MKKLHTLAVAFLVAASGLAQSTLVNYNFNSASSYPISPDANTSGITGSFTSTESFQTYSGVATGTSAFAQNTTAGNAIAMANSSGTNTRYFTLQLSGTGLSQYQGLQLYLQSQKSSTGAGTITIATSTDGTNYTPLSTNITVPTSFGESVISLTGLNGASTIYIKLMASGASGTGTLRIDNLEIQGNLTQNAWQSNGSNIYYNTGNVGVNNNAPSYNLDVTGSFRVSNLAGTGSRLVTTDASGAVSPLAAGTSSQVLLGNNTWGALPTPVFLLNGTNAYYTAGKVGIGNSNPNSTLDVTGSVNASTDLSAGGNVVFSGLTTESSSSVLQNVKIDASGNLYKQATGLPSAGTVGSWDLQGNKLTDTTVDFIGTTDDKDLIFKTHGTERMRITSHSGNNHEEGRVYIGNSPVGGSNDIITANNDLPGNWDDKLIVKNALRVVNDNLVPSTCALFGNDGLHTYIESFSIPRGDVGNSYSAQPDDILMGYYSGANVSIFSTNTNGGYLNVQNNVTVGRHVTIGSDDPASFSQLYLRGLNDQNHGLGWFSSFNNGTTATSVDGPVLYGYGGGALASKEVINNVANTKIALQWDNSGNVNINGNLTAAGIKSTSSTGYNTIIVDANGKLGKGGPVTPFSIGQWNLGGNTNVNGGGTQGTLGTLTAGEDLVLVAGDPTTVGAPGTGIERMRIDNATGNIIIRAGEQFLINNGDLNHGLGYYDGQSGTVGHGFGLKGIDGPVLYGWTGGALGTINGSAASQKVALRWNSSQQVFIGDKDPNSSNPHINAKLAVGGDIVTTAIFVTDPATTWADFVFDKDYKVMKLDALESFYKTNHHLPNVPTTKDIQENGNDLAKTDAILLQKIEELTLYLVEQNKAIETLKTENQEMKKVLVKLEKK